MKIQSILLTALLAAALSVSAFAQQNKGPTAWVFSKAVVTKQGLEVPPTVGAVNVLTFTTGATVASDAEAPGGKVVVLDGTQTAPGISLRTLTAMDAFLIKLNFSRPSPAASARRSCVWLAASCAITEGKRGWNSLSGTAIRRSRSFPTSRCRLNQGRGTR